LYDARSELILLQLSRDGHGLPFSIIFQHVNFTAKLCRKCGSTLFRRQRTGVNGPSCQMKSGPSFGGSRPERALPVASACYSHNATHGIQHVRSSIGRAQETVLGVWEQACV